MFDDFVVLPSGIIINLRHVILVDAGGPGEYKAYFNDLSGTRAELTAADYGMLVDCLSAGEDDEDEDGFEEAVAEGGEGGDAE